MRSRVRSIAAVGDKQRSRIGNICRNESENGADDESGQKPPRSSMRTVRHGESTDSRQPLQQTTPNPATASIRAGQGMRLRNRRTGPSFSPRRDTQRKLRRRPRFGATRSGSILQTARCGAISSGPRDLRFQRTFPWRCSETVARSSPPSNCRFQGYLQGKPSSDAQRLREKNFKPQGALSFRDFRRKKIENPNREFIPPISEEIPPHHGTD